MKSLPNVLFLLTVSCLGLPGIGNGASLQFIQDGWQFGGPLQLSFTGEDSNLDGWIDRSELSAFRAEYRLPDGHTTAWLAADIQPDGFLFFDLGNFLIFTANSEYSLVNTAFEGEVLASVFDRSLFPVDETQAAPVVTPEPTGMVWIGLATIAGLLGRRGWRASPPPRPQPGAAAARKRWWLL